MWEKRSHAWARAMDEEREKRDVMTAVYVCIGAAWARASSPCRVSSADVGSSSREVAFRWAWMCRCFWVSVGAAVRYRLSSLSAPVVSPAAEYSSRTSLTAVSGRGRPIRC